MEKVIERLVLRMNNLLNEMRGEKFFLEVPTLDRKQDVLDYLEENVKYGSDPSGIGSMYMCLDGSTYEEWLLELERREDIEYVNKINRCLSKTFFVIRISDNRIVGMINVRYNIAKEKLGNGFSHIGYGIRPTERGKGYAKMALYLGLIEEQKRGEDRVLIVCAIDNIGSNKTIQALGGKLEETKLDLSDNIMTNYYWINVDETIKKYSREYDNKIEKVLIK